ncbi:MAG: recombinase family protein [Candidatus Nomurabacteria bacterium]|nr:recombinase family protein [Candidatus Nomurabacteria bacterium]USN87266.1 MAG: recombinase family protein [Candidatus Nomurabacteria bacterium]
METQQISARMSHSIAPPPIAVRYVLYARKSTEQDERQALSIESQVNEMMQMAEKEGLDIVEVRREAHSAKASGQRPVYREILEDIRREKFNGIIVWHPDRLSRNAGDLGELVDLMDQKLLVEIRTHGQTFTNNPSEKFLLMILCSQAKLENDNKSINVKRGLKARVEMGLWPAPAPTGYVKEKRMDRKCETLIDPERAPVIKKVFEKVAYEKWSGRKVYNWLRFELNFRALPSKKHLSLGNIYRILENHFYYGVFEYPRNSGNWYQGRHEPLITKELFDLVQEQLKGNELKTRQEKEFAFTKLMICGLCGSGISADEKYKKLKNGKINAHVYYTCTKARDKHCKCGYLNETDLIKQLQKLVDVASFSEGEVIKRIKAEVARYKKFNQTLLGEKTSTDASEIDAKSYIKFLLKDGTIEEKREILSCFNSKITMNNKVVKLQSQPN